MSDNDLQMQVMMGVKTEIRNHTTSFTQTEGIRYMVKFMLCRWLEGSGHWVACGSDRYLIEQKVMQLPSTGKLQQNLIKLEINPFGIALEQTDSPCSYSLSFNLNITIRLCKLNYVDCRSIVAIGDQTFFKTPAFDMYCLAELY
jgi:hypothetical protein